jgi:phosphoribosylformylglycinamidine cyclo-ligase
MSKDDAYSAAGVDYDALDAGKRLAMAKALSTSSLLAARGGRALDASRGEPAFVFELGAQTLAFVVEGLGTKSIIARHVLEDQGDDRFADVAYDTVAAIVNDLCCVGALPLVVNAYFATGASQWYLQRERSASLLEGWRMRRRGLRMGRRRVAVAPRDARRARHRAGGGGRRGRARRTPRDPRRAPRGGR